MYTDDAIEITSGMNESPSPVASPDEKWSARDDTKTNGGVRFSVANCFSFKFYLSLFPESGNLKFVVGFNWRQIDHLVPTLLGSGRTGGFVFTRAAGR